MCVCVCVCVWRERENEIVHLSKEPTLHCVLPWGQEARSQKGVPCPLGLIFIQGGRGGQSLHWELKKVHTAIQLGVGRRRTRFCGWLWLLFSNIFCLVHATSGFMVKLIKRRPTASRARRTV